MSHIKKQMDFTFTSQIPKVPNSIFLASNYIVVHECFTGQRKSFFATEEEAGFVTGVCIKAIAWTWRLKRRTAVNTYGKIIIINDYEYKFKFGLLIMDHDIWQDLSSLVTHKHLTLYVQFPNLPYCINVNNIELQLLCYSTSFENNWIKSSLIFFLIIIPI